MSEQGIVNCCCPYFKVVDCGDTEEHKHIRCEANGKVIPNSMAVSLCVSDHNWGGCPIFAEECFLNRIL